MLDLRPVETLAPRTKKLLLFHAVAEGRPQCFAVVMKHGVPVDYPDDAGGTVLMDAIDVAYASVARAKPAAGDCRRFVESMLPSTCAARFGRRPRRPGNPFSCPRLPLSPPSPRRTLPRRPALWSSSAPAWPG